MMDQCQVRAWTCVHAPVEARLCSKCWLDVEVQNQTVVKQIQFIMNLIVMIISCINVEIRFLFKKKSQLDGAHFDTIILQQNPSVCISSGRKHDFSSLIFTAHLLFTTSLLLHLLVTSHPSVQTVCSTKQGWTITILIILFDSKTTHFSFIEALQSLVKLM